MGSPHTDLPIVAIVGRPNVGKSTLFNRLVGRRRSITDATPGVTRDVVSEPATIGGRRVVLVDTGGYTKGGDELSHTISERAIAGLQQACAIVLVVDATSLTAEDEEFVEVLRSYSDRVLVAVNKIDTDARDDLVWEALRFGFDPVLGVSAAHGRGTAELAEAIVDRIGEQPQLGAVLEDASAGSEETAGPGEERELPREIRIAILGQPNTGKSTLANRLVGRDASIVSEKPGTTRDVIAGDFLWRGAAFELADTAGIRRKSKVSEPIEYYSVTRAIDTIATAEVVVLMIDATKGLAEQDKKIANLIVERGRGVVLALNKWDLLPEVKNQFEAIRDRIRFFFPILAFAPIVPISAQDGSGVEKLMATIVAISKQLRSRVETGKLNRAVQSWVERTPPPMRNHRPFRVRYATQVGRLPVTFVLFVNRRRGFPASYVQFLKNRFREEFGIDKIPIRLELRERS